MGRWSRLVAPGFVDWLAIAPGGVWLDVGCGTGALSAAIDDLAAPMAITGVDSSPELLAPVSDPLVVTTTDHVVGDAVSLPFSEGIFDVAVSGLVLDALPDPLAALREQARVVAADGIVAAYVWDYADGMHLLRHFWDAARQVALSAVALDEAVRFPHANPVGLARLFEVAGLDPLESTSFEVRTVFADFEELWLAFELGQGPAPRFLAGLEDGQRASLRVRLRASVPVADDGSISLSARAWAIRARP